MQFKAWYDKLSDTITITEDDGSEGLIGFIFVVLLLGVLLCALVLAIFFVPQILLIKYAKKKFFSTEERSQFLARGNAIISTCYSIIILYLYFFIPGCHSHMFMLMLAMITGSIYCLLTSAYAKYKLIKNPPTLDSLRVQWLQQCTTALKINAITLLFTSIISVILVLVDPTFLAYFL